MFSFLGFRSRELRYAVRSPKWQVVRKQHIERYPNCAACGKNRKVEVHHIKPVHKYPDLELELDNLITLCDDPCHFVFGHLLDYKSWNSEVIRDCEVYYNKIINRPK